MRDILRYKIGPNITRFSLRIRLVVESTKYGTHGYGGYGCAINFVEAGMYVSRVILNEIPYGSRRIFIVPPTPIPENSKSNLEAVIELCLTSPTSITSAGYRKPVYRYLPHFSTEFHTTLRVS